MAPRPLGLIALALTACACCPHAGAQHLTRGVADRATAPLATAPAEVRMAADLGARHCFGALQNAGVGYRPLHDRSTRGVAMPVRLSGTLHGVAFESTGGDPTHEVIDCRLVLALNEWSRHLASLGIDRVEYFSAYRPGARVAGSGKVSGHAHALAFDAARFHLRDGRVVDVERDWASRERGGNPCPVRRGEPEESEVLRSAVCEAVAMGAFQVILTPHHDRAHHNHVHMELVPDVDWTYIR